MMLNFTNYMIIAYSVQFDVVLCLPLLCDRRIDIVSLEYTVVVIVGL